MIWINLKNRARQLSQIDMIVVWMMYRIKYIQGIFLKEIKNVIRGEY